MNEDDKVAPDRAELEAQVAAHPFLIGMSEHHIHLLADCAMRSHFEAGYVIFRDGELLGWSWLFPPYAWHFTARAVVDTTAIFFYGTILREYSEKDHSLGFELFKRMSAVMLRRLQAARQKLLNVP